MSLSELEDLVAERVVTLIRSDRIAAAKDCVFGAKAAGLESPRLDLLWRVLFPAVVESPCDLGRSVGSVRFDSSPYTRQWVALRGSAVVASANDLKTVLAQVSGEADVALIWVPG